MRQSSRTQAIAADAAACPLPGDDMAARIGLLTAAALVGFGVILWVAAHWSGLAAMTRFGIVGGTLASSAITAMLVPRLTSAGSLLALLSIGGLLAVFGQTYQSGADPWQLFALWAALGLPLALAARSDAVWCLWIVVAHVAIGLFAASAGIERSKATTLAAVLPAWLLAIAVTLPLSRLVEPAPWRGGTRWAYRLSGVLTLWQIAGFAAVAVFAPSHGGVTVVGLLLLAAAIVMLAQEKPADSILAAAAVLAIDAVVGSIMIRTFMTTASDGGAFLFLGLLLAGLVTLSAWGLLALLGRPLPDFLAVDAAARVSRPTSDEPTSTPWPVAIVSGIGALFATIPFLVFVASIFGALMRSGVATLLVGAAIVAAGIALLRRARAFSFRQQFGVICLSTGIALAGYGLVVLMPVDVALLVGTVGLIGIARIVPDGWIRALAGFAASFTALACIGSIAVLRLKLGLVAPQTLAQVLTLLAVGVVALGLFAPSGATAGAASRSPIIDGWLVLGLLAMMALAGPTFLLSGAVNPRGISLGTMAGMNWGLAALLSCSAAFCAIALLVQRGRFPMAPLPLAGSTVLLVLAAVVPGLGISMLTAVVCWLLQRRALAALALIAALWQLGAFYYWLGWPLDRKALLLVGLGVALGTVALFARGAAPSAAGADPSIIKVGPVPASVLDTGLFKAGLIAASLLVTLITVGSGVRDKQAIIASGRLVYVALTPVDPRSLIQGDFMTLRFELPSLEPQHHNASHLYASGAVDERGVARIARLTETPSPASGADVMFRLARKNGQWLLGTDAWHFKEGTAKTWEAARFGQFRVDPRGNSVLVGLTDQTLRRLE